MANESHGGASNGTFNPVLSFAKMDIERRLSLPAGRFTQTGVILPLILGVLVTVGWYAALIPFKGMWIHTTFTERGWVPYVTVFFSCWALMILLVKSRKIALQRRALALTVVPEDADFVLSVDNVDQVLENVYSLADDPRKFILLNRIQIGLSNLRNMGQIGDVDGVLRSQAENDEMMSDSGYTVVRGLLWAIPVLGFIGTVLGLSQAIGSFRDVLEKSDADLGAMKAQLQVVISGLATAFETTLHALVAAVVIQMLLTALKRSEEQLLDGCMEYCQRHVVGRLRLIAPRRSGDGA